MGIAQHPFGHQLRGAIGRDRRRRGVLEDRQARRIAVDGGGRGEDEARHSMGDSRRHQRPGFHRVVEIVAEGIADRIRHHDRAGEMDDGVEAVFRHQPGQQRLVAGIALDQPRPGRDRPPEARRQIVENHHVLAGVGQRQHHVAADIPRPARHQYRHRRSH
jgi:hypothetical protein